jgi:hypothetical protein
MLIGGNLFKEGFVTLLLKSSKGPYYDGGMPRWKRYFCTAHCVRGNSIMIGLGTADYSLCWRRQKGSLRIRGEVKPKVSPAYYSALEERFRHVFNYMG